MNIGSKILILKDLYCSDENELMASAGDTATVLFIMDGCPIVRLSNFNGLVMVYEDEYREI